MTGTWLITGGAGFVGRHVVREMLAGGGRVVVLDDLSSGDPTCVPPGVPHILGTVTDPILVRRALVEHAVDGVIHLAAQKSVAASVADPCGYYRANLMGTLAVVEAAVDAGVRRIVHASSAAVYGEPQVATVDETCPAAPVNPYGQSKLAGEWLLCAAAQAHGLQQTSLRYFNVAGTSAGRLRDTWGAGLVPQLLEAVLSGYDPIVFGAERATPDGTCVRDFVHVADVARAHRLAAEALGRGGCAPAYNIGSGEGVSVLEMIAVIRAVTRLRVEPVLGAARAGDPDQVVADPGLAARDLGWQASRSVLDIVSSEWRARCRPSLRPVLPVELDSVAALS